MKCKYCKASDLPDHSRFCPWCGKKLQADAAEVKVPPPTRRPSGSYYGRFRVGEERIYITAGSEAEYYVKARAAKVGMIKTKSALPRIQLGKAIDKYLQENRNLISPSTLNSWQSYRKTRFKAYMDQDMASIPWQKMINDEAAVVSGKTVINAWDLVRHAMDYVKFPRPDVKLPKKMKAERKWLDYDQIKVFLEAIEGKPYELGALLALHGLRRSELLHLEAADIDLANETIRVRGASVIGEGNKLVDKDDNKTAESTRTVHIVIPRLKDLLTGKEGRLVTSNPTTLYGLINGLCKKHGLPEVGVHGLRHSFASLAYHLKWSEATTMREGGWNNPKIVHEIYTHLAAQDANEDIKRMKDFYSCPPSCPPVEKVQ